MLLDTWTHTEKTILCYQVLLFRWLFCCSVNLYYERRELSQNPLLIFMLQAGQGNISETILYPSYFRSDTSIHARFCLLYTIFFVDRTVIPWHFTESERVPHILHIQTNNKRFQTPDRKSEPIPRTCYQQQEDQKTLSQPPPIETTTVTHPLTHKSTITTQRSSKLHHYQSILQEQQQYKTSRLDPVTHKQTTKLFT
jgi:hypothetical protein